MSFLIREMRIAWWLAIAAMIVEYDLDTHMGNYLDAMLRYAS